MKTIKHTSEEKVWFISDLHLGHTKDFLWKPRGFKSVEEMNKTIIENIKKLVGANDHLYLLGDLVLCPIEEARALLSQLPGKIHVIIGNHDTDARLDLYQELGFDCQYGARMRYGKYHFFLSHYPTLTANPGEEYLTLAHINIYGHTHQDWTWCSDQPFAFCVCPEAHANYPIEIKQIIEDLKENLAMKEHGLI